MKRNATIKIKAAFLLAVFSLNTVVGFACSIGVDMGFNSRHHEEKEAAKAQIVHIHEDGKKHVHDGERKIHIDIEKPHKGETANKAENSKSEGNCCTDKVKKFQEMDKSVPGTQILVHPTFFTAFLTSYYYIALLRHAEIFKDIRSFVRSYHPPISDLRIAIQSFQI